MNTAVRREIFARRLSLRERSRKEEFREKFQRSLRSCLRRGFSLEESFGMIWVETWEEITLSDAEQSELYDEMIGWAKKCVETPKRPIIHRTYSQPFRR